MVSTELEPPILKSDLDDPLIAFLCDSSESASVVLSEGFILGILSECGVSQIRARVVELIPVDMIVHKSGPLTH